MGRIRRRGRGGKGGDWGWGKWWCRGGKASWGGLEGERGGGV